MLPQTKICSQQLWCHSVCFWAWANKLTSHLLFLDSTQVIFRLCFSLPGLFCLQNLKFPQRDLVMEHFAPLLLCTHSRWTLVLLLRCFWFLQMWFGATFRVIRSCLLWLSPTVIRSAFVYTLILGITWKLHRLHTFQCSFKQHLQAVLSSRFSMLESIPFVFF